MVLHTGNASHRQPLVGSAAPGPAERPGAGSKFLEKSQPTGSLLVQGNGIPAGAFLAVEAFATPEDAEAAAGEYELIDTPTVVEDTLLYSASKPADEADLDAVVEAAGS